MRNLKQTMQAHTAIATCSHTQPEFPDAYWSALEQLSLGREIALPRPHPKFTVEDMARIAQEGPRFHDVVLEHAEALRPTGESAADLSYAMDGEGGPRPPAPAAVAYNYVPSSVLGDWRYEVEPNWKEMEAMPLLELYQVPSDILSSADVT